MHGQDDDPDSFDPTRHRREIELMEQRFRDRASRSGGGPISTEEIDQRVHDEMKQFFVESNEKLERVVPGLAEEEQNQIKETTGEIRRRIDDFFTEVSDGDPAAAPPAAAPPPAAPQSPVQHGFGTAGGGGVAGPPAPETPVGTGRGGPPPRPAPDPTSGHGHTGGFTSNPRFQGAAGVPGKPPSMRGRAEQAERPRLDLKTALERLKRSGASPAKDGGAPKQRPPMRAQSIPAEPPRAAPPPPPPPPPAPPAPPMDVPSVQPMSSPPAGPTDQGADAAAFDSFFNQGTPPPAPAQPEPPRRDAPAAFVRAPETTRQREASVDEMPAALDRFAYQADQGRRPGPSKPKTQAIPPPPTGPVSFGRGRSVPEAPSFPQRSRVAEPRSVEPVAQPASPFSGSGSGSPNAPKGEGFSPGDPGGSFDKIFSEVQDLVLDSLKDTVEDSFDKAQNISDEISTEISQRISQRISDVALRAAEAARAQVEAERAARRAPAPPPRREALPPVRDDEFESPDAEPSPRGKAASAYGRSSPRARPERPVREEPMPRRAAQSRLSPPISESMLEETGVISPSADDLRADEPAVEEPAVNEDEERRKRALARMLAKPSEDVLEGEDEEAEEAAPAPYDWGVKKAQRPPGAWLLEKEKEQESGSAAPQPEPERPTPPRAAPRPAPLPPARDGDASESVDQGPPGGGGGMGARGYLMRKLGEEIGKMGPALDALGKTGALDASELAELRGGGDDDPMDESAEMSVDTFVDNRPRGEAAEGMTPMKLVEQLRSMRRLQELLMEKGLLSEDELERKPEE